MLTFTIFVMFAKKRGSVIVMLLDLRNCNKLARISKGFSGDWTLK